MSEKKKVPAAEPPAAPEPRGAKTHTVYQGRRGQAAGLSIARKKDANSATVKASELGAVKPQKGDRMRLATGEWVKVTEVERDGNDYTLGFEPEGGE